MFKFILEKDCPLLIYFFLAQMQVAVVDLQDRHISSRLTSRLCCTLGQSCLSNFFFNLLGSKGHSLCIRYLHDNTAIKKHDKVTVGKLQMTATHQALFYMTILIERDK